MTSLAIPLPSKVICVGLNYRDHASEGAVDAPERPLLFAKWPNTLIGHGEPIVIPAALTEKVDDEGELGVVIGRRALGVAKHDALDVIHGYEAMTLEPGDLILTGTPAGVGAFVTRRCGSRRVMSYRSRLRGSDHCRTRFASDRDCPEKWVG